jgi:hypothetical protein
MMTDSPVLRPRPHSSPPPPSPPSSSTLQAEEVLEDCREFLGSEAWYSHHGAPRWQPAT